MNKITSKVLSFLLTITLGTSLSSCKKDFLEAKPSTNLLLLSSIADYQKLLSNESFLNQTGALPIAASDEYVVPIFATYQTFEKQTTKNSYIWSKNLYGETSIQDWSILYTGVFYANSVLDALNTDSQRGSPEWRRTKGWALFSRAFAYYDLARNFCNTYESSTAGNDLGLPLKLTAGIDEVLPRSNLQQTYEQIIDDLSQSKQLLTNNTSPIIRNEPSKAAAAAMLARVYLSMRNYIKAENYADSALSIYNTLIDYNTVSKTATSPFSLINDETIYQSKAITDYSEVTTSTTGKYSINPDLLALYDATDLRKQIYFITHANGTIYTKRGYSGRAAIFTGLAVDELYLIKAECAARRSDITTSLSYLNSLLVKRYQTGNFVPRVASTGSAALAIVLEERRKELIRRGLRWSDLKRLNKEGLNITLTRTLNGQTYELPPNDPRYVFPIPEDEIRLSGITQNIR